ncbi:GNAT family N-acetyltransferase [Streptomyces sp. NPDC018833]|uniref:GNAT family N-acetyltransferase n=1 Tax=Streptomyces sp. NPDC018833 TaxID=3365053 RepID=UPI0037BD0ADD
MISSLGVTMRPYAGADEAAVLELINADRLVGQPEVSSAMLAEALAGRSSVDSGWWEQLDLPDTYVAIDGDDSRIVGVISYAVRGKDQTGQLLWLHCHEDSHLATTLIAHACTALKPRPMHAFDFASALTRGLEGLPVGHRPATRSALEDAGFRGQDLWRYMHAPLPSPEAQRATRVKARTEADAMRVLRIRRCLRTIAEARIGEPVAGVGVLWWISVKTRARRRGLGRKLLGSALHLLYKLGATEAILYVDDDAPPGDGRDRTAAKALYDSVGFTEVDRLYSYTRPPHA